MLAKALGVCYDSALNLKKKRWKRRWRSEMRMDQESMCVSVLDAAHKPKCRRRIQPPLLLPFLPTDVINT